MFSILNEDQLEKVWSSRHGNWYEKVSTDKHWATCKSCGVLPRLWVFNNGAHAQCLCKLRYEAAPVRSESILSVYKRTELTAEYDSDNLRVLWNKFAEDGIERNTLGEGKW